MLGLIHLACLEDNTSASGTQSHKPGMTGHLGRGCSAGLSEGVFFLLGRKEAYMCPVAFILIY